MARTLAFAYKRGDFINTAPSNITFDEETNGRAFLYTPNDFSDLLEDLRSGKGIHTPIWCQPIQTDAGNGLKLVAGQRRLLAALEYQKESPDYLIRVLIVEPKTEQEALEMNVLENAGHLGLTFIDKGHVAVRLREEPTREGGRTLAQIGKMVGLDPAQVALAIKIVEEFPEAVTRLIAAGKVTVDDAKIVLRVTDPEKRKQLVAEFFETKAPKTQIQTQEPEQFFEETTVQSTVPVTVVPPHTQEDAEKEAEKTERPNLRDSVRNAGGKVPLRAAEFKKYLQEAIDEDGPGSNKGEVKLKTKLLAFLNGEISQRTMDDWFNKMCKMKGE